MMRDREMVMIGGDELGVVKVDSNGEEKKLLCGR